MTTKKTGNAVLALIAAKQQQTRAEKELAQQLEREKRQRECAAFAPLRDIINAAKHLPLAVTNYDRRRYLTVEKALAFDGSGSLLTFWQMGNYGTSYAAMEDGGVMYFIVGHSYGKPTYKGTDIQPAIDHLISYLAQATDLPEENKK